MKNIFGLLQDKKRFNLSQPVRSNDLQSSQKTFCTLKNYFNRVSSSVNLAQQCFKPLSTNLTKYHSDHVKVFVTFH